MHPLLSLLFRIRLWADFLGDTGSGCTHCILPETFSKDNETGAVEETLSVEGDDSSRSSEHTKNGTSVPSQRGFSYPQSD